MPYFLSFLISILPQPTEEVNVADRVELNHHYDAFGVPGKIIIDQVILYNKAGYSKGWLMLMSRDANGPVESVDEIAVTNPVFERSNRVTWYRYKGGWRTIVKDSKSYYYIIDSRSEPYETWTNYDPELEARDPDVKYRPTPKQFQ